MRSCFIAVTLLASVAAAEDSVFPTKEEKAMARLLEPQQVSADARAFLKSKMKAHSKDMRDLVLAVATLRYDDAKKFAQGIANAPRLDKASAPSLDLDAGFFVLQDTLRKQATAVVSASEAKNAQALANTFSTMISTCMSCHNAFLAPVRDKVLPAK
jgi:hypothetical protein